MTAVDMIENKRKSVRRPVHYGAWLALDSDTLHDCSLSDISDTGARLDIKKSDTVPDRFVLLLSGNGAAQRKCRVIWRTDRQVGVKFEQRLPAHGRTNPA